MTLRYKRIFTSILFILISIMTFGQELPPIPPPPPPGLSVGVNSVIVLAFGIFYGVKKLVFKDN